MAKYSSEDTPKSLTYSKCSLSRFEVVFALDYLEICKSPSPLEVLNMAIGISVKEGWFTVINTKFVRRLLVCVKEI